ncbi:hypothetical protein D3C72_664140 [compost metagenome]
MMDTIPPDPDLSPSLGGDRAVPEAPAAPPPIGDEATDAPGDEPEIDLDLEMLRDEIASILGPEGAEVIETLTQIGTLGVGLGNVFAGALQAFESQLPQTLAAFGGLFDAVEQAVGEALDPTNDTDRRA